MQRPVTPTYTLAQLLLGSWAVLGVLMLLSRALVRLVPIALEPLLEGSLTPAQLVLYFGWILVNAYTEGYRGFALRFVPRVLGRLAHLLQHPTPLRVILAPLFVMGYFDAKRRALLSAWGVSLAVVLAVLVMKQMPQPWRGILDGGVVMGLAYGLGAFVWALIRFARGTFTPPDPEVPEPASLESVPPEAHPDSAPASFS